MKQLKRIIFPNKEVSCTIPLHRILKETYTTKKLENRDNYMTSATIFFGSCFFACVFCQQTLGNCFGRTKEPKCYGRKKLAEQLTNKLGKKVKKVFYSTPRQGCGLPEHKKAISLVKTKFGVICFVKISRGLHHKLYSLICKYVRYCVSGTQQLDKWSDVFGEISVCRLRFCISTNKVPIYFSCGLIMM